MKRTMYLYEIKYQEKVEAGNDVWLDFSKNILAFENAMMAISLLINSLRDKTIRIYEIKQIACVDHVCETVIDQETYKE